MKTVVQEKVELLQDLCILKRKNDPRKKAVRQALKECGSELRMEIMLHDVIMGRKTLDELLVTKGLM